MRIGPDLLEEVNTIGYIETVETSGAVYVTCHVIAPYHNAGEIGAVQVLVPAISAQCRTLAFEIVDTKSVHAAYVATSSVRWRRWIHAEIRNRQSIGNLRIGL